MRKITKDYAVFLAVAYTLLALIIISMFFGFLSFYQYFGLLMTFMGFAYLYWGYYYFKGNESFSITIPLNFFVRKRNLEYYDAERMLRDMGKWQIIMSALFIVCGALIFFVGTFTDDISFLLGVCFLFFIAIIAAMAAFLIVCRKSKYLKDPNVTPPKRGIIRASK